MPNLKEIKIEDFEAAAMTHFDDILGVALRQTRNRAEAERLTEQVFLQAWKAFRFYRSAINCRAWLLEILFSKSTKTIGASENYIVY